MIRQLDCCFSQVVQWLCAVLSPCFAIHWSFWDSELPWDLQNWHMSLTASNCICLRVCCLFWQSGVSMPICLSLECKVGQLGCKSCADQIPVLFTEAAGGVVLLIVALPVCSRDKGGCLSLWAEVPCRDLLQCVSPAQGDWMASLEILIPLDWCIESSVCSL